MYAGLLPVIGKDDTDLGSLFFWMFSARTPQKIPKLVFWLNGGPGCSSMDGLFLENGPFIPTDKGKSLAIRNASWYHDATIVYVDQPVGTGYSHVASKSGGKKNDGFMYSLTDVAASFRAFLDRWLLVFSDLAGSEVYIAGESYAGQYLPYIAKNILSTTSSSTTTINLKGMLIGNGWMDPHRQYLSFVEYGLQNNLISGQYLKSAITNANSCKKKYESSTTQTIKSSFCEGIMDSILNNSTATGEKYCLNMYDIRLNDDTEEGACGLYSWPPNLNEMKSYLGRADVKAAVHVPNNGQDAKWEECNGDVHSALSRNNQDPPSFLLFEGILERIPVLLFKYALFAGDMDLICNWIGIYDMVENMSWNGAKGMKNAPKQDWFIDSQLQGWYQTSRNLTYVLKYNASHMMPVDSPIAASDMFNRFIGVDTRDPLDTFVGTFIDSEPVVVTTSSAIATTTVKPVEVEDFVTAIPFVPAVGDDLEGVVGGGVENTEMESEDDAASFGAGAFFLIAIILGIVGYLVYQANRTRLAKFFGGPPHNRRGGSRSHEWMELNATGDGDEDGGSVMEDDELDAMLELESGPSSGRKRVNN
ncbi:UNVERIFIED_CONTAM: Cell death protease [Siphonaria sp. JEL0065]|nr:Cell death protease [Siphonaria sp. JEL0065]